MVLSVGLPLLGVTQHPRPVELGLSSPPTRLPEDSRLEGAATRSADYPSLALPLREVKDGPALMSGAPYRSSSSALFASLSANRFSDRGTCRNVTDEKRPRRSRRRL